MAAAAFVAYAGAAGWGFWATFAAVAVGTYIDTQLLAPGGTNYEGPRLNDLRVISSTYGNPIPLVYGPENRLSGNVIWSTGLIETAKKKKSGGKGGGGSSSSTTYSYRASFAVAVSGNPLISIKRIWANNKLIFDINDAVSVPALSDVNGQIFNKSDGTHVVCEQVRFWPGSAVQVADSVIESFLGAGETPAYRHRSYVVFKDMQLADFGNRLPNVEFELSAHDVISSGAIVNDICDRAGISPVSTAGLTEEVRGYMLTRSGPVVGSIAPLGSAYSFDISEVGGNIRFVKKGRSIKGTIPIGDMGAKVSGGATIEPRQMGLATTLEMPKEIIVTHLDPAMDYQTNSQRAGRDNASSSNRVSIELPMTLPADEAIKIAYRLLWEAQAARRSMSTRLTDKWIRSGPGEIFAVSSGDDFIPMKMTRMTRGVNGILDVEYTQDDPMAHRSEDEGIDGNIPENTVRFPGVTELTLIDGPILQDMDDNSGFYWAVTAAERGWRGAEVLRSSDGGTSYSFMSDVVIRSTIGDVAVALPTGPTDFWDEGNTLTVVLAYDDDELESLTDAQVFNGNNAFWLGPSTGQDGEIVQFRTATLIAPKTYTLSGLLRGRLGTEANTGIHGANETFVLIDLSVLGRSDYGPGDWNSLRSYKPVSFLTDEADTTAQDFTNTGTGKRPLAPVHVLGVRDSSNNLTVTATRRTRYRVPGLGNGLVPLGEETEEYTFEFYDFAGSAVVRTVTTSVLSYEYTAAQQTADGLSPGSLVRVRIYQMSTSRGRGFPAIARV